MFAAFPKGAKERRSDVTINVRAPTRLRNLIDRAAAVVGKSRTQFMLDSAQRHAEDVLLDQRFFLLGEERYSEFLRVLESPPKPIAALRKLLSHKAPWEK